MNLITQIKAHVFNVSIKTNWVFISVKTNDGSIGWGEASLNGWEPALKLFTQQTELRMLGMRLDDAIASLKVWANSPGGLVLNTVTSAVAQALLDLQAQTKRQTLHGALSSLKRPHVPLYANVNRATTRRTPEGFVATASRALMQGFNSFKVAPFDGVTPDNCHTPDGQAKVNHGVACMRALRTTLGSGVRLMVDCHWRFDEACALDVLRQLEDVHLYWYECPIAENHANWPAYRRIRTVANAQGVLLAAAESQVGLASFQTLIEEALFDVIMPDIKYCGGPWEMLAIARYAHESGVLFSPHNPSGPIASQYSLAVAAVAPECGMLELQYDESAYFDELVFDQNPVMVQGSFPVQAEQQAALKPNLALIQSRPYKPVPPGVETILNGL